MKANPQERTLRPPTAWIRSLGLWLGLSMISSALAFVPEVEHRLQGPGLGAYAQFGTVVDISGDTAVVGCPGYFINNAWVGAAFVFVYRDGQWLHQATLIPDGAPADTDFGSAVAISHDTIVVGAYRDGGSGPFSGKAYVFTRSGEVWTMDTVLTPADAQAQLQFGDPVAIDQDRIAIGAIADNETASASGAVYLFHRDSSGWRQEAKIKPQAPVTGALFGFSVSLNGDLLAVGAPFHTHGGMSSAGAAYVFQEAGGVWSQLAECMADDATANNLLGWSVAVASDSLLVGAPLGREGILTSGAAYHFQPSAMGWPQTGKLTDSLGATRAWFGFSVALQGNVAAIGASQDSGFGATAGAVCLFSTQDNLWQQTHKFNVTSPSAGAQFGFNLALDGNHLVVGAPFQDEPLAPLTGAAFAFSPAGAPPANEPPVADAGATPTSVLAANGSEADVYLDGSRSSDPEGVALTYRWLENDALLAETQTTVIRLAVGSHTLSLQVSDGVSVSSDVVQIDVVAPADLLNDIIDHLQHPGLPTGQAQALEQFLTNARRALERNRHDLALHHLQIARDYLRVQAGRQLDPATAGMLEDILEQFVDALLEP